MTTELINVLCAVTLLATCAAAEDGVFEEQVRPILGSNCVPCHSTKIRNGGFSIDSLSDIVAGGNRRGPVIAPGKPDDSVLIQVLTARITPQMPLGKPALSPPQVETISKWIASMKPEAVKTVPNGKWWSFEKPRKLAVPDVRDAAWARNEIDRFVLAKLEAKQLSPSPEATPRALLRRAY